MFASHSHITRRRSVIRGCLIAVVLLCACVGCVRRRMSIDTNPPGATVYLDNKEIGKTPLTTSFDHYGYRTFRCVKDQYETKTVTLPVRAPWYEWIGLDFFSEVLLPGQLVDNKEYVIEMTPQRVVPQQELIDRAEETRRLTHAGQSLRVIDPIQQQPVGSVISPTEPLLPPNVVPYQPQPSPTATQLPVPQIPASPLTESTPVR